MKRISGYDTEGDSRVVTELIRRIRNKNKNDIQNMNILKQYGGMGYKMEKIKKSFVK